jgi:hypothetical protein
MANLFVVWWDLLSHCSKMLSFFYFLKDFMTSFVELFVAGMWEYWDFFFHMMGILCLISYYLEQFY